MASVVPTSLSYTDSQGHRLTLLYGPDGFVLQREQGRTWEERESGERWVVDAGLIEGCIVVLHKNGELNVWRYDSRERILSMEGVTWMRVVDFPETNKTAAFFLKGNRVSRIKCRRDKDRKFSCTLDASVTDDLKLPSPLMASFYTYKERDHMVALVDNKMINYMWNDETDVMKPLTRKEFIYDNIVSLPLLNYDRNTKELCVVFKDNADDIQIFLAYEPFSFKDILSKNAQSDGEKALYKEFGKLLTTLDKIKDMDEQCSNIKQNLQELDVTNSNDSSKHSSMMEGDTSNSGSYSDVEKNEEEEKEEEENSENSHGRSIINNNIIINSPNRVSKITGISNDRQTSEDIENILMKDISPQALSIMSHGGVQMMNDPNSLGLSPKSADGIDLNMTEDIEPGVDESPEQSPSDHEINKLKINSAENEQNNNINNRNNEYVNNYQDDLDDDDDEYEYKDYGDEDNDEYQKWLKNNKIHSCTGLGLVLAVFIVIIYRAFVK